MEIVLITDKELTTEQLEAFKNRSNASFVGIPYILSREEYQSDRLLKIEEIVMGIIEELSVEHRSLLLPLMG